MIFCVGGCVSFCEERLCDFLRRDCVIFKKSCMIFVVERLCDCFGGCMIFFGGEVKLLLFVEKLRFVDILHDFFVSRGCLIFHSLTHFLTFF